MVCFASGTRLRTVRDGASRDVRVEDLAVGDHLVTASGAIEAIRWIGHRSVDCRRHPRPDEVQPIRIAAHAFGPNLPARDLVVSPGHSICVDVAGEVLMPACVLANGTTIAQLDVATVTYWHVELDRHDIVLAENLPTESYLDMGNRDFFVEEGIVGLAAAPDASVAKRSHADFCRPFVHGRPLVAAIRLHLHRRAVESAAASSHAEDRGVA